ncbi:MAG: hypothetical protein CO030_01710 [Candidatus Magasanikbacteria bacterium CG_4_9_14_0_2_um_filter_42_11]|uniref:Uncharacterized protein n=1 Tax=Candidatus Magasanikbacteria bacterium CG_4_9_14_0_2_um_filter_42_11 TaxID=1974643 RepID=A0A2M8FAA2_9BACT|nr:MAG: hypothetical protein COU34_00250 [Candidatus Magasanikbacteria bacterium CG10_big_fil_rev_8_21_14_0_10_43_9]PIY92075.1 MAG: hypothetical protein COY70_05190 [Candidatus Magasanikbacteria bacterium CG_4_10_14_0_8_um_filter_42_12]PJC52665.1 MAG: hypothetical protein CO030_01710 [Candidatus Magasanikbacteria bacterium CG_4_9_14_0_2_um_filter_42_11]
MQNGDNRRRSYGYTSRSAQEQEPQREERPVRQLTRKEPPAREKAPVDWVGWLLFPFRLLGMLLIHVFKALGWVLKKIPWGAPFRKGNGKRTFKILMVLFIMGLIGAIGLIAWASKDLPDPNKLTDRQIAQSTKIYDRTGEHILYEVFEDQKRTLVTLDELPDYLVQGVIATEDTKFYEHHGVRPLSILRAVVYGLLPGRKIEGTSTLTQQLVKNAILTNERRLSRKLKEFILSVRLEQVYTKDQILQIYFNEIPYGSTNYGVESAAQSYFGKAASDLTLAEAATLAGMPQQPSRFLNDLDRLKERRNFVLRRMNEEGYISEAEKTAAQAEPLNLDVSYSNIDAPHFVLYVKEKLVEDYGEQMIDTGGLKVITSLDWEKQQIAEAVVDEVGTPKLAEAGANNTSLVALDPRTGQILAMVGSKDFYDDSIDGQFNVATLGKRQPGSSFKPIIYAAAFEKGYTPNTILYDVVTNFASSGKSYTPKNYDLSEHGPVTMRQALQGSLNIPAVKALYLVGDQKGVDFAERLGYTTLSEGDFGLSLVLGGGEVRLIDHVSAYAVFANEGVKHTPVSILKVEDKNGDIMYEWKQDKGEKVLDKRITDTLSNVLSDDGARAYAFGAGGILTLPGRPVAAKTGTTNGYVDAWTVGYTPSLVAGVWAGNTDNTAMKRGYGGSSVAAPIWNEFMKRSLEGSSVESFAPLPEIKTDKPVLNGSTGGGITLKVDEVTGKIATSSTPEQYIVEKTFIQPHSILHYVNKDDPQGPAPEDPNVDSQYAIWEQAIQDWIVRKQDEDPEWKLSFGEPPTEYDDSHSLELIPSLEIIYPAPSSTIHSRQIDTDIRVSAPRGVTKVTYQLDGVYVGVVREHPFNLHYYAQGLSEGVHTLIVQVEDDVGNKLTKELSFTLANVGIEAPSVSWSAGSDALSQSDFPRVFLLSVFKKEEIARLEVSATKGSQTMLISTITDFSTLDFNNGIAITWQSTPESGTWTLIAKTVGKDGSESTDTKQVSVGL